MRWTPGGRSGYIEDRRGGRGASPGCGPWRVGLGWNPSPPGAQPGVQAGFLYAPEQRSGRQHGHSADAAGQGEESEVQFVSFVLEVQFVSFVLDDT